MSRGGNVRLTHKELTLTDLAPIHAKGHLSNILEIRHAFCARHRALPDRHRFPLGLAGRRQRPGPAPVENVSSFPPRSPDEERKAIHLPPGFEIQLVASEPAIHKPLNLAFDDRGRLWVTDTVEYPYPAAKGTKPRDSVNGPSPAIFRPMGEPARSKPSPTA